MLVNINKFGRFSMCDCLTIRMDKYIKHRQDVIRTYTPFLMTLDVFLNLAFPGTHVSVPFKEHWPGRKGIKDYEIPVKINTFLFSPFHAAFHHSYYFDSIRWFIPKEIVKKLSSILKERGISIRKAKTYTQEQFKFDLKKLDKKVTAIWNPKNKILVFYNNTWAPPRIKNRLILFDNVARETLDWKCISVVDNRKQIPEVAMWHHYERTTYTKLYDQIAELEKQNLD